MSYSGGKGSSGVHQTIINKMPKHRVYIETHLGGGTIMIKKKPARINYGIEINQDVLEDWYSTTKSIGTISQFINDDCVNFLKDYPFTGDELIYADPPYLFETRKSQKKLYKHEYDINDHIELLELLNSINCFIMISGYRSELYERMLDKEKWHSFDFQSMTRGGIATETLWCNFNPSEHIKHDYSYIGSNYRERERIKRKSDRWIKNLNKLPADERNYLLSNIADSFGLELSELS